MYGIIVMSVFVIFVAIEVFHQLRRGIADLLHLFLHAAVGYTTAYARASLASGRPTEWTA